MRRGLALFAALVITLVIALVAWVDSDADEAAWAREADTICADAIVEHQALFEAYGPPNSPEVIRKVFASAHDSDQRAFARLDALKPPESRVDDVSRLLALWKRHLEADNDALADLKRRWSDSRLQEWMSVTYPITVELEQAARALGSGRCGDYFSPDPF